MHLDLPQLFEEGVCNKLYQSHKDLHLLYSKLERKYTLLHDVHIHRGMMAPPLFTLINLVRGSHTSSLTVKWGEHFLLMSHSVYWLIDMLDYPEFHLDGCYMHVRLLCTGDIYVPIDKIIYMQNVLEEACKLSVVKDWVSKIPRTPYISTETIAHSTISCDCG